MLDFNEMEEREGISFGPIPAGTDASEARGGRRRGAWGRATFGGCGELQYGVW